MARVEKGCSVRHVPMTWGWWGGVVVALCPVVCFEGWERNLWRSVARVLRAQVCLASQGGTDGVVYNLPCVKTGGNAAQIALGVGGVRCDEFGRG